MNCKQGDLAVIKFSIRPENIGRIVKVAELIGRDPVSRVVTADGKEQITGVRHYWRVYQRNIPEY